MSKQGFIFTFVGFLICAAVGLTACSSNGGKPVQENLLDKAAQEATAIIQQAQATALVLQAQAQATAVVYQANKYTPEAVPEATWMAYVPTAESTEGAESETQGDQTESLTDQEAVQTVEVVSVGLAGEGGLIIIRFLAPVKVAERWWQGSVSVEVESSDEIYNEIPVLPRVGPLIGRPKIDGQYGYVMLVNSPPGLQSGSLVTVVLGDYRFEHIVVE